MKKYVSLFLAVLTVFCFCACTKQETAPNVNEAIKEYKIGVITGDAETYPEEYQAADSVKNLFGNKITLIHSNDISSAVNTLAADETVKVIIIAPAITGTNSAIDKAKRTRSDILFICCSATEDIKAVSERADITMLADTVNIGTEAILAAYAMGAKTFIEYSFTRELSEPINKARRELMIEKSEELGLRFLDATMPDPQSTRGLTAAEDFIKGDLPRQLLQYGNETAFFSTNPEIQPMLIKTVIENRAIMPMTCNPSPYFAYAKAFGIDATDHSMQYMLTAINERITSDQAKRMGVWKTSVNAAMLTAACEYAEAHCQGKTIGKADETILYPAIENVLGDLDLYGISVYDLDDMQLDNVYFVLIAVEPLG